MNPFATDDGYTATAFLPATDERPALRIYYRPTNSADRSAFVDRMETVINTQDANVRLTKMFAEALVARITKWEWLRKDGSVYETFDSPSGPRPVPEVSMDSVMAIKDPLVWEDLKDIVVWGKKFGERDPFVKEKREHDCPKAQLAADQKN